MTETTPKINPHDLKTGKGNRFYGADLGGLRDLLGKGMEYGGLFLRNKLSDVDAPIAVLHNAKEVLPEAGREFGNPQTLSPQQVRGVVLFRDRLLSGKEPIYARFADASEMAQIKQASDVFDKAVKSGDRDHMVAARQEFINLASKLSKKYFDQFVRGVETEMHKRGIPVHVMDSAPSK